MSIRVFILFFLATLSNFGYGVSARKARPKFSLCDKTQHVVYARPFRPGTYGDSYNRPTLYSAVTMFFEFDLNGCSYSKKPVIVLLRPERKKNQPRLEMRKKNPAKKTANASPNTVAETEAEQDSNLDIDISNTFSAPLLIDQNQPVWDFSTYNHETNPCEVQMYQLEAVNPGCQVNADQPVVALPYINGISDALSLAVRNDFFKQIALAPVNQ